MDFPLSRRDLLKAAALAAAVPWQREVAQAFQAPAPTPQGWVAGKLTGARCTLRLRTNLEIFWDHITWAEALPNAPLNTKRLPASTADLRYRGFSVIQAKNASTLALPFGDEMRRPQSVRVRATPIVGPAAKKFREFMTQRMKAAVR